jgi:hypothetical protein
MDTTLLTELVCGDIFKLIQIRDLLHSFIQCGETDSYILTTAASRNSSVLQVSSF